MSITPEKLAGHLERGLSSAYLVAGDERLLGRVGIETEAHLNVSEVDARILHRDGDVVVAQVGVRLLSDGEALGGAELLDGDLLVGGGIVVPR